MQPGLSRTEREVLTGLAFGDRRLIWDGATLHGLACRGLAECRLDGWAITSAGRRALQGMETRTVLDGEALISRITPNKAP